MNVRPTYATIGYTHNINIIIIFLAKVSDSLAAR